MPTLQPGDIVIADNLSVHKIASVRRAIEQADATLWYLPPYSPDLNPIELCFAKLKAIVRAARCRSIDTLCASPTVNWISPTGCLSSERRPAAMSLSTRPRFFSEDHLASLL